MDYRKNENFIILVMSLACVGLTIESILLKWEFWVPPLIIIGTVLMWVMNILQKPDYIIRRAYCLGFAMLSVFYYGIHETSLFDVVLVVVLAMVVFSFFNRVYMMYLFLIEYAAVMFTHLILALDGEGMTFEPVQVSRVILHFLIVIMVYYSCLRIIKNRIKAEVSGKEKDEQIENYDADMEDFLSNISHELRTPVNVVNGMSELLIKRNIGKEAFSIKDAGIRLAYQIEDIQDYTECKREKAILEEDDYMSTSLINDVVTGFRLVENNHNLELVVDLAPSVPMKMRGDIKKLHKIFRHLLENSVKFTKRGGIYVRMYSQPTEYGVNLCIEMTDTGIGMDRKAIESVSEGMYQVNKKRNRSSGGIGLGLYIVYGFTHRMGGFVKIESEKNNGTTVRVTIPQKVVDESPCLGLGSKLEGNILFHVKSDKYKVPKVRDFYRSMAAHLAKGINVPLYSADSVKDIERLKEQMDVTHIFMGQEEYEENPKYFDDLSKGDIVVAVSAYAGFNTNPGSRVIVMPKPLYAYPAIKILNEGKNVKNIEFSESVSRPKFKGVKALIVDDEPMNLVVATSLFSDYDIEIDTAGSGREAINKFSNEDYDVVFMDHMMPEMDGVEAMKIIKKMAQETYKNILVVALTANAVSGAREMFIKEGFDGFIAKPINMSEFERVMVQILPDSLIDKGGEEA